MTFNEWVTHVSSKKIPSWSRWGQFLVNEISVARPDLGIQLTSDKEYDCFYRNDKVPAFFEWAERNW